MNSWSYPVDDMSDDEFVEPTDQTGPFHIGQFYEKKAAVPVRCKECGATEFNVARGEYYTAIRCPFCRWEVCIHGG